jgi:dihydroorotate dehydrogenase
MKYSSIKPLLFLLEPEFAHNLATKALKYNLVCAPRNIQYSSLNTSVLGINFLNPIGMAAGFDKNAQTFSNLFNFGFGFVECGTVTPKPQSGNEKPRLFRLKEDAAIINRLGFNNLGADYFAKNLENKESKQILGINIGKNKDTINALDDYLPLLELFYDKGNYITINISSPNTKNLRNLQKADELDVFLKAIMDKKNQLKNSINKNIPILLKIAPDLNLEEQEAIAGLSVKHQIDGIIISNTTIYGKENLLNKYKNETGGLSGKPLFETSNLVLKHIYKLTCGKIPLVGVGGISSASDAYKKIKCGASLVQIYSAFIYEGFELVEKIKKELDDLVKKDGLVNISQAVGIEAK